MSGGALDQKKMGTTVTLETAKATQPTTMTMDQI